MPEMVKHGQLQIAANLYEFMNSEALEGLSVTPQQFWDAMDAIVHEFAPRNRALVATREELQQRIDAWHKENSRLVVRGSRCPNQDPGS